MKKQIFFSLLAGAAFFSSSQAVIVTGFNSISVVNTSFDLGANPRSPIESLPISASQQGGSYYVNAGVNGVGTVASGTAATPGFSLTITNNTGQMLDSINLRGTVFQLKGNTGGAAETLTAGVTGVSLADPAVLNINTVLNQTGINNPPVTMDYSVNLTGLNLGVGQSMTITWTDANDSGTDAFFGLSNLTVQAVAVPEPHVVALVALGGGFLLLRRRFASRQ